MNKDRVCPECRNTQYSAFDIEYLNIFGHCWLCDRIAWNKHGLSTKEFEKRENIASNSTEGGIDAH